MAKTPSSRGRGRFGESLTASAIAVLVVALLGPGSAVADHEIERIEGSGWALSGGDGTALGGKLQVERIDEEFFARIVEPPPNECFEAGTTIYELSGHEPEYTGVEYYAFVRKRTEPERVHEVRADEEVDPDYECTGAFTGHPAKLTVSVAGPAILRFGGGATDSFLPLIWDKPRKDTDGDGLLDDEEVSGINIPYDAETREPSPKTEVDLRRMGADPERKDLFWEVDQMPGHELSPRAVADLAAAFERAPVPNPDGSRGISLHVDAGPGTLMDPATGRTWGELSESDSVPFRRVLGSLTPRGEYVWDEYQAIKNRLFDNCPDGGGVCESARSLAFRYAVTIHRHPAPAGGESRGTPAVDSVIALQCPDARTLCNQNDFVQTATVMHEMGHNLGLGHGGIADTTNFKPNHFSVMNYNYAAGIPLQGGDVRVSYSDLDPSSVPDLDERRLNERRGVQVGAAATGRPFTIWRCARGDRILRALTNGPADFNCNGRARGNVATDVNDDGARGTLSTSNEWQGLLLDPRFPAGGFPLLTRTGVRPASGPATTASVEEPGWFDTMPLIFGDRKKPRLRIKKRRRGRNVVLKVRARDNKHLDRLIVDLRKPVGEYVERRPQRKRRPAGYKVRVPKRTKVGVVAIDLAGNVRERRFRAR
jgi:hypothetical protein